MSNNLRISVFFLVLVLLFSCNSGTKPKELKKTAESSSVTDVTATTDDLVSFISGMPGNNSECIAKLASGSNWNHYARELDSMFFRNDSLRFKKMKGWADSELIRRPEITTIFYPFSGPDFLNANIFYPDADQYIMIGLEPIGYLPDICNMPPDSVTSYLNKVNNSLKDIIKRSYFITSRMNNDLKKTKVNGTVPLISLFIKRTGHKIISIQRIGVDSTGKWQISDSLKNRKNVVPGIKIDFQSLSKKKIQSVYYFRTDISDKGLGKKPGFTTFLSELPGSYTYLKAASYLMHAGNFKIIRSYILSKSSTILQDDSGIAYRYFDKEEWNIRLYGKYSKPKEEFSYISEPDLEKAYKSAIYRPLSYTLGYNWGVGHSNMLYAIRK